MRSRETESRGRERAACVSVLVAQVAARDCELSKAVGAVDG